MFKNTKSLDEAKADRTGFVRYHPESETMENLFLAIVGIAQLLSNIEKGCTFSSIGRDYAHVMGKLKTFGNTLGIEPIPGKKKR